VINSNYLNKYNLLNAKLEDEVAENSPLWSIEYLLLKWDDKLFHDMLFYTKLCKTDKKGLYNQFPFEVDSKDKYTSPDQLIAFLSALKLNNEEEEIKKIWKYLWTHLFTYDNISKRINFNRTMQPSAIFFCGYLAGIKIFGPLLSLSCMVSCIFKRKETSGKLKAWVLFKVAKLNLTEKICNKLISTNKHFKTWKNVFFTYFQEESHPIRDLFK